MKKRIAKWFFVFLAATACAGILGISLYGCGGESVTVVGSGGGTTTQATIITLSAPDNAVINFGENVNSGLMSPINPSDVDFVRWNSNKVGWGSASAVTGVLWSAPGNFTATVVGMPPNDKGNFSAVLKSGAVVWFDLGKWKFSTNAVFDSGTGQVEYTM